MQVLYNKQKHLLQITGDTVVCARHFKKEDYRWTLNRKCLKPGVVPSVFEWKDDFTPRKQPRVRLPLPSKTSLESNIDQADEVGECEDHTIQPNTELLNENQ